MEPLQLGMGIPSGCQIGAKGAQCAFDGRRAVEASDLNSAFTKERRQNSFKGVHKRAPRMLPLPFYLWGYGASLVWTSCGNRGEAGRRPSVAGPLFFAVSTFELFESIRDAAEKLFALLSSFR
jgi:hypothetical protein